MDLMLDLETMSTRPNAAIVSIGAVMFDPFGPLLPDVDPRGGTIGGCFYTAVLLESSLAAGLVVDGDTVMWWLNQAIAQQKALSDDPIPLSSALDRLYEFSFWRGRFWQNAMSPGFDPYGQVTVSFRAVWSHGASFDLPIIESAYRALDAPVPWTYRHHRDTRTLFDLAEHWGYLRSPDYVIRHHALCDAYACARDVQRAYASMGLLSENERREVTPLK